LHRTAKGVSRRRLIQRFNGLEVIGTAASVEVGPDGQFVGHVSGTVAYNLGNEVNTNTCNRNNIQLMQVIVCELSELSVCLSE
jgi:hypothetical protein